MFENHTDSRENDEYLCFILDLQVVYKVKLDFEDNPWTNCAN